MANIMDSVVGNIGGATQTVYKFATITFWGLIGIGVVYIIMYFLRFNVPLYIYKEEGNGIRLLKDRGEKNKKKRIFRALKNKDIEFPYPESKFEFIQGKKAALTCYVRNQSATWLEISPNPHFVPADYNMQNKMINDFDATWNIVKPKTNFWDKYGQQILWFGSIGIFLVVIILILKRMDKIIEMGNSMSLAQASQGKQVISSIPLFIGMVKWKNKNKIYTQE